jgi:hypothetical protein
MQAREIETLGGVGRAHLIIIGGPVPALLAGVRLGMRPTVGYDGPVPASST